MNIFCHIPRENWIVDRMGIEFKAHSKHNVSFDKINEDTNIIWLLGSWCWNQIPINVLKSKKVVCTIHHEVPWKFDDNRKKTFLLRDQIVNEYLTYTKETAKLIFDLTGKTAKIIPHWINTKIWKHLNKEQCRKDLKLPLDKFIIGSFQRDTEGNDLISPKLEKGPDIFIEKVLDISKFKDVHVLLGGWRRQYVISKLNDNNIKFTYFELPNEKIVNMMYNSLDLYLVSSRCEGGPQSIFESSYLKIPVLSTPAGQYHLLDSKSIYKFEGAISNSSFEKAKEAVNQNFKNFKNLVDEINIKNYDKFFEEVE